MVDLPIRELPKLGNDRESVVGLLNANIKAMEDGFNAMAIEFVRDFSCDPAGRSFKGEYEIGDCDHLKQAIKTLTDLREVVSGSPTGSR